MPARLARRRFLQGGGALVAAAVLGGASSLLAEELAWLDVAAAGSVRAMLEGPLKVAAKRLGLNLRAHAGGADGVARTLIEGSLRADVFLPITAGPMQRVMAAGKIAVAYPVARTELVLVYSPKSRYVAQFEAAAAGRAEWWKVLQQPGMRIARSNPANDPSGRAIYFAMMLAAKKYRQADLVAKVLGDPLNPTQVLAGGSTQAMLQSGELDAMGTYKIGPVGSGAPYVSLPENVNLSRLNVRDENPELTLVMGDKTFYPEPLVFYAGVLKDAANAAGAAAFVQWLRGAEARGLFAGNGFAGVGEAGMLRG